jgi:reverse gyrase
VSKILWTLRESRELSAALWQAFKDKAIESGHSPTAALGRIIRRYLDRGFEDGAAETGNDRTSE